MKSAILVSALFLAACGNPQQPVVQQPVQQIQQQPVEQPQVVYEQQPVQQQPQVVVVQQPQQNSGSGFMHGLIMGHMMAHANSHYFAPRQPVVHYHTYAAPRPSRSFFRARRYH